MNFFKRLLDSNDPLSTKALVVLVCLLLLVLMVARNLFFGILVQPELVYIIASVLTAGMGATLLDRKRPPPPDNNEKMPDGI